MSGFMTLVLLEVYLMSNMKNDSTNYLKKDLLKKSWVLEERDGTFGKLG